ncbi:hypothetical protein NRP93_001365 [Clostridium botulinum]|nr:hypothetical protein [Clostridium botulinum]
MNFKKLLSILMIAILGCILFTGCGSNQKEINKKQDEMINQLKGTNGELKELTEGEFFNSLAGVAPGSKIFYILNKDKEINRDQSLAIEMNITKDNKKTEINDFVNKTIKVTGYLEKNLVDMRYSNLLIFMYVDGKSTGNSISYVIKDNKLEHKDTLIDEEYYDAFQKAKKEKKS